MRGEGPNQKGDIKSRIVAISGNGGENWDTAYFDRNLPDPICHGSLLIAGRRHGKMILAFCNPADTTARDNLTLQISMDEGATWLKNYVVDRSGQGSKKNYTAYSDLVKTGRRKLGILYERADNSQIVFTVLKW